MYCRQQDPAVALVALVAGGLQYGTGILTEYGVQYIQPNVHGARTGELQ
jgi:hypothetical protein